MTRHPHGRGRAALLAALAVASLTLSACTAEDPSPSPSTSTSSQSDSSSPTPSVEVTASAAPVPALVPDGSASDNLAYFASITAGVWATDARAQGRAYVDALTAGGFDKAAMQVTADTSTVGNAAESIQFSVLWKGECLIGQVGPATGNPVTVVARALQDGTCLVGSTRPIDW